jgi:hypothetical protein
VKASVGSWADPNSVRPDTRRIGRYIGRVSGWDSCHPVRIGLRSVRLRSRQNPARVELLKGRSGRVLLLTNLV